MGTQADVLEAGAGTGQQVLFLKEKYRDCSNITVRKDCFEEFNIDKKYDLIYSATAFHWVKSEIGYPKAWEMLKPGGTMAVFWQMSSVTYHDTEIFAGLNSIKQKYLPNESLGFDEGGIEKVREKRINQIQSGGYFQKPEVFEFRWIDTYDAERYTALINTYSSTQLLEDSVRESYLGEIKDYILANGGKVEMPQLVMLYLVRKM